MFGFCMGVLANKAISSLLKISFLNPSTALYSTPLAGLLLIKSVSTAFFNIFLNRLK